MTTPLYSCVKLTEQSHNELLEFAKNQDELYDRVLAHHMTIHFEKGLDLSDVPLGDTVQLQVTGYAKDTLVQCVKVNPIHDYLSVTNQHPHVTVSVSPEGKPKNSNDLLNKRYTEVQHGPVLEGVVGYYTTRNEFKTKEE